MSHRLLATAALVLVAALPAAASAATAPPSGRGCDRLDDAACLLPFPNDAFTRKDRHTATGLRLALGPKQTPRNADGVAIDPTDLNRMDGFSPGSVVLTKVPGLATPGALARTNPVGLARLGAYARRYAPVLLLDARTGERQPIWVELDSNAAHARDRLLEIHPARNLTEGRRYVVVLRGLRTAAGRRIKARRRFAALRDGVVRTKRYDRIFRTLKKAKVRRGPGLFLTWDFTVASRRSLSGRMLRIRDDAFAQLGDRDLGDGVVQGSSPRFTLGEASLNGDDAKYRARWGKVLEGDDRGPLLPRPARVRARDRASTSARTACPPSCRGTSSWRTSSASCRARRPRTRRRGCPSTATGCWAATARSSRTPTTPRHGRGARHRLLRDAVEGDVGRGHPERVSVLQDLGKMPSIADRLQQGMLDALYLGRLMIHPQGLAANPLLQQTGRPIVRTDHLYYDGNSQGGIMGGALTAVAPDYTRAVLGVPAMNYSVLLPRSVDFDTYSKVLYPKYPDELERPLALDLAQVLWDRGEADGYAQHMTSSPLPDTPRHVVLMHVAFGDHQVTQYQADVEARTIGARIHTPILAPGRSPAGRSRRGASRRSRGTYPGRARPSCTGTAGRPASRRRRWRTCPTTELDDPHEFPRRTHAARQQKSDFLQADGKVVDVCAGGPCVAAPDVG